MACVQNVYIVCTYAYWWAWTWDWTSSTLLYFRHSTFSCVFLPFDPISHTGFNHSHCTSCTLCTPCTSRTSFTSSNPPLLPQITPFSSASFVLRPVRVHSHSLTCTYICVLSKITANHLPISYAIMRLSLSCISRTKRFLFLRLVAFNIYIFSFALSLSRIYMKTHTVHGTKSNIAWAIYREYYG